jgi:heme/copper-type cytochrome/quinol oxidase subunit 4
MAGRHRPAISGERHYVRKPFSFEKENQKTSARRRQSMNAPPIAYAFSVILLIAAGLIVNATHEATFGIVLAVILVLGAITIPSWLKMTDQWNRAIILRLGRFRGLGGPGPSPLCHSSNRS